MGGVMVGLAPAASNLEVVGTFTGPESRVVKSIRRMEALKV
jgi:hypothetical protein